MIKIIILIYFTFSLLFSDNNIKKEVNNFGKNLWILKKIDLDKKYTLAFNKYHISTILDGNITVSNACIKINKDLYLIFDILEEINRDIINSISISTTLPNYINNKNCTINENISFDSYIGFSKEKLINKFGINYKIVMNSNNKDMISYEYVEKKNNQIHVSYINFELTNNIVEKYYIGFYIENDFHKTTPQ